MSRIPYKSDADAGPPELVAEIRARRGGQLLNLDRMLLHSAGFARGWNAHLGAVRRNLQLNARLRELAICAVAVLNRAEYEYAQHAPEFLRAGGSAAQLQALLDVERASDDATLFSDLERCVLRLSCEMTRRVEIDDASFEAARRALGSDAQLVELIGVIATYNMVSRFLVALGVESE